jgi:hypothetical protein
MATLLSQTEATGDWISNASLAALDEAAEAALDRRLAVDDAITFDELIEQMASFTADQQDDFMAAFRLYSRGMPKLRELIADAFEQVGDAKMRSQS